MSRSYRKTPIVKDNGKHKQYAKRQANKKVRKSVCSNGCNYKKVFESWDVMDWKFRLNNPSKKDLSK
jgi:hypothetical protein